MEGPMRDLWGTILQSHFCGICDLPIPAILKFRNFVFLVRTRNLPYPPSPALTILTCSNWSSLSFLAYLQMAGTALYPSVCQACSCAEHQSLQMKPLDKEIKKEPCLKLSLLHLVISECWTWLLCTIYGHTERTNMGQWLWCWIRSEKTQILGLP